MKGLTVLAAMAVIGVVFAGCGDDDGEALSEDEFLRQGNTICAEGEEEIVGAAEELFGGGEEPTAEQISDFWNDVVRPRTQEQIDGIDDLEPPEDMQADVDELVDTARAALEELEERVQDDPIAAFESEDDPFAEANAMAEAIGLNDCSG
jgi:hypothetical protein